MPQLKLTMNTLPMRSMGPMEVRELRDALSAFNQTVPIVAAIPQLDKPHEVRSLQVVGHIDHPGEARTDHTIHAVDIICDHWDRPDEGEVTINTVADLAAALAPFPDPMHVRVVVPLTHESISHRMLDIVMVGRAVGNPSAGPGVQIVCENWDSLGQVIRAKGD